MADQATIDSVAGKFGAWAESLSAAEQTALADWLAGWAGREVSAHRDANWWQQPGAWSSAWTESWNSE